MKSGSLRIMALVLFLAVIVTACASTAGPSPSNTGGCAREAEPTALEVEPDGEVTPPKVLHRVAPLASGNLFGRSAVATIEAVIGEDGKPRHICIAQGDREWGRAMEEALAQWRFEPGTLQGKPVAVRFVLTSRWGG